MARCKDCIHEKVCLALIKHGLPWNDEKYPAEKLCFEFLNKADVVPKSEVEKTVDDLKRYIILNENIAIKCKQENGEQNEEYWKGKISAFKQIRAYIDTELKKKYTKEV